MLQSLRYCLAAIGVFCALATTSAHADVPSRLVVQGYLTDLSSQRPLHGTFDVVVTLYDMSGRTTEYQTAGGTATDPQGLGAVLWTETQVITAEDGRYSVVLGAEPHNSLPDDLLGSDQVELGLAIDGDSEMTPRLAVTTGSVPYALQAREAEQVTGDIEPLSLSIGGQLLINENGEWVGPDSGLIGPKGDAGDAGPAGADGVDGAQGAVGPVGPAGADGAQGPVGPQGPTGADGVQGPVGPVGPTGAVGAQGPVGPVGPTGAVGAQGPAGPVGPTGADGAQGPVGPQGPTGADGAQGPVGPQGMQGLMGPSGTPGMMGPPGPIGPPGTPGTTGPQGPMGPTGMTGPAGSFSTSNVTQKPCNNASSCTCNSGVVLSGGVDCPQSAYIISSYPSTTSTWSGTCESWNTGQPVNPDVITITCATAN
ncbi:hypothetical protein F1529_11120 [Alcanivorax sp. VBW004]|uniref:collagen-like protein n=2 Tax=Alcanivorax TaxID=59753 RepID=UPI0012BC754F|nr:collagen-like protein [Alcanivorax sp. VBW004]MTT53032.1 hypothetical protein [Alcanivorax sp. VBW004]